MCLGGGDCDPGESHENDVILFGRSEGRRERVALDTLPYSSYRVRHTQLTKNIQHMLCIKTLELINLNCSLYCMVSCTVIFNS